MTQDMARSMGSCQALMHLATDAVQAAIESPFLEGMAGQATGALCCVSLPPGALLVDMHTVWGSVLDAGLAMYLLSACPRVNIDGLPCRST